MKKRILAIAAVIILALTMLFAQGCDKMSSSYESDTFEISSVI